VREKFVDIWPIWNFAQSRQTRLGFLLAMGMIDVLIGTPIYFFTNKLMKNQGDTLIDPTTALDLAIPIIPWTIIIYFTLFYFFYPLPAFSMPKEKKGRYEALVLSQALIVIMLVSNIWFVISPAEVYLRYDIDLNDMNPIYASMFEALWLIDSPYNAWPSLHVSTAGIFTLFAMRWWSDQPLKKWGTCIIWILMCLSILTTRQHFILDLITALMLLGAVWKWQVKPTLERLETMDFDEVTS